MRAFSLSLLFILLSFFSLGQDTHESYSSFENFQVINSYLIKNNIDPKKVLLVNDFDNNLMANDTPLGSDQWFSWQESLLGTNSPYRIANNFKELLHWYLEITKQDYTTTRLTDPGIRAFLKRYKKMNFSMMILTARSFEQKAETLREIKRNQIIYANNSPLPNEKIHQIIPNFDRPIFYHQGLALVDGQNKGEFLKYLLSQSKKQFTHIIMLDDKLQNLNHVHEAFQGSSIKTLGIRFAGEDGEVKKFMEGPKEKVHQAFLKLKASCNGYFFKA